MIPVSLSISGFLSYKDPAEIDFTSFDLACISGQNGSGKSSILDGRTSEIRSELAQAAAFRAGRSAKSGGRSSQKTGKTTGRDPELSPLVG